MRIFIVLSALCLLNHSILSAERQLSEDQTSESINAATAEVKKSL